PPTPKLSEFLGPGLFADRYQERPALEQSTAQRAEGLGRSISNRDRDSLLGENWSRAGRGVEEDPAVGNRIPCGRVPILNFSRFGNRQIPSSQPVFASAKCFAGKLRR